MINIEHNKINNEPYLRVTSDLENYYVKVKGSEDEPTNEIMVKGTTTDLEFEEVYIEPIEEEEEQEDALVKSASKKAKKKGK